MPRKERPVKMIRGMKHIEVVSSGKNSCNNCKNAEKLERREDALTCKEVNKVIKGGKGKAEFPLGFRCSWFERDNK